MATQGIIELHGKTYRIPGRPVVVVCVDGFDPSYLDAGVATGILPVMASWLKQGFHATVQCAMPSVTNSNNVSIITGVPSKVHGINGNYYLDKATGEEVMVLDDSTIGGSTILAQLAQQGVRVAAITAKDKLRRIINHCLSPDKGAICFSAQYADTCTLAENGIEDVEGWLGKPTPAQYSGDLSLFVLDAGVKLLQEKRADVFYLTLSDFVQHKHAPGSPVADDFMHAIDSRLGELQRLGALVAVTGDHGMSVKCGADGSPNVLFLEDHLNEKWPRAGARVLCPIADPFVKHHGALGGFVRVHLTGEWEGADVEEMLAYVRKLPHVQEARSGEKAASVYELPPDREGEFVVISKHDAVVGSSSAKHDLSELGGMRLRSHGGLSERDIPLLRSEAIETGKEERVWHNYDIFDLALNL